MQDEPNFESTKFFDKFKGNAASHDGRLLAWNGQFKNLIKLEYSLDYFAGLVFGVRPFNSVEIYRAHVRSTHATISANLTSTLHIELFEMARFALKLDLVPFVAELALTGYMGSALQDDCLWLEGKQYPLLINTYLTKDIAQCGVNLRDVISDAKGWDQLLDLGEEMLLPKCRFTQEHVNEVRIDFLSGIVNEDWSKERVYNGQCLGPGFGEFFDKWIDFEPINADAGDVCYDCGINGWDE